MICAPCEKCITVYVQELSGLGSTYTQAEYVTIATGLLTADHISSTIDY